ncbi:HNH endonuclease [Clostridium sp.]|uniref:HNH endonuclease n=1 Tax=Clostridium sp. TaxID=1506 RepID=UPI003F4B79D6
MKIAIQIKIDKNNKDKNNPSYDIIKAFSEHDVLPWGKERASYKNLKKGDDVYIALSKPYNNQIMYKCLIVDDNADSSTIDDSEYVYPPLTKEEKIKNSIGACLLFKKIKCINDERLCMANLKNIGISNVTYIHGSIKNENKNNIPMFEYIDKIFDEELEITTEFKDIVKESEGISKKYRDEYIKIRIGQGKFREALIEKHGCKCAICGLDIKELLIASHIKEYSKCEKNEHIDSKNGLLLCANHDKLFDKHLISFYNNGKIVVSPTINHDNYIKLNINEKITIDIDLFKEEFMRFHRDQLV